MFVIGDAVIVHIYVTREEIVNVKNNVERNTSTIN